MFNLIIGDFSSLVQVEAGVCRKLFDEFKHLKNRWGVFFFNQIFEFFYGGIGIVTGFPLRSLMYLVTSAFSNSMKAVSHTFLFISLYHWRKQNKWKKYYSFYRKHIDSSTLDLKSRLRAWEKPFTYQHLASVKTFLKLFHARKICVLCYLMINRIRT